MIPITTYKGKRVAVFGLGGSGLTTAEALIDGGAEVIAWDDSDADAFRDEFNRLMREAGLFDDLNRPTRLHRDLEAGPL